MENIIMISLSRWDDPFSSVAYSLAKELSKNHRVFYVDHPFTIKDFVTNFRSEEISRRKEPLLIGKNRYRHVSHLPTNFVAVTPGLTFPINMIPPGKMYDFSLKMNNWIVSTTIKSIITDYNIKDYIFFNSFNPFFDDILPTEHPPKYRIYQSIDDISESEYVSKHGVDVERKALSRANISFGTSRELCRTLSTDEIKVRYLPNAADITIFKKALEPMPRPKELQGITSQIIGYTGCIGLRQDYELLRKVAETFHDKTLLMVGPRKERKYTKIDFAKYPNVIFTGPKDITELPAYLHHIDCAIIPFKCNKLTASIYPLKVNEYLAAGKAVVATNFSEEIAEFVDVVDIATNHDQFLDFIRIVLKGQSQEKIKSRVEAAEKNTWESRVASFWEILNTSKAKIEEEVKGSAVTEESPL